MAEPTDPLPEIPRSRQSPNKPLRGVRVIDAGTMVAGPFCAVLLADLGADVIKIEHPRYGDGQRKLEPIKDGTALWWKAIGRNKRCITLDLGKPQGAEAFKDLVRGRDAVVENYRPGTFERWGIGYDVLKSVNPGLVLLRVSGFGQTGPYRSRPGFGRVAEAVGGLTNLIGEADGPPMSPGYPLGDLISGLFGAMSVMVALYHRDLHGGEGQTIDLALYEAVFRLLDFDAIQFDQLGTVHRRTGNQIHVEQVRFVRADRAVAGAFPRNDRTKPVAHGVDHRGSDAARGRAAGDDGGVRAAYRQPAREIGPEEPRRIMLANDPFSGARLELADDFGLRNTRRGSWHAAAPVGHECPGSALRARRKAILPGTG